MFNLNFDICLVPFHVILTEITVFKLKQTFLEPPRISWKGPIKTNWTTFTIFLRLLFQLVGWFHEVSCSGSKLCSKKSRHERVPPIYWDKSMCDSNNSGSEAQFERASWSDCYSMPQLETANDPKFFRLYDFTGKMLHSCWGTCIQLMNMDDCFWTTSANVTDNEV
jgi:hypothetical protein